MDTLAPYAGNLALPFSPEAEQSVLGAVLLDSSCLDRVMEILPRPDYFHQVNNRLIYQAMQEMFTEGRPVDFVTVLERLKEERAFDEGTGKTYLMQLAQIVPSISNVETYAKIVRDKYDIRTLIVTARQILEDAADGTADAAMLLDAAEQRIFDIRRGKNMQGLQRINELVLESIDRLELLNSDDEKYKSVSTGIRELDDTITGLSRSDLILLAARPGMGKTSFALNIMRNAGVQGKKKIAFFSLEMTKEQLVSRLLSTEGMISATKLRTGKLDDNEWVRLIEAGDILSQTQMYFDDSSGITVPEIKAKLRRLKDVDLVIIDYLQLMSGSGRSTDSRQQEISDISRSLKALARELHVPVVALSQLSRAVEQRPDHRPMLSDLRESGAIEQDADVVMFIYRDDYYNKDTERKGIAEIIIAKQRNGPIGTVELVWLPDYTKFANLAK